MDALKQLNMRQQDVLTQAAVGAQTISTDLNQTISDRGQEQQENDF